MEPRVATLLSAECVCLALTATSQEEAILEVAGLLDGHAGMCDAARFCAELLQRELASSTVVGESVAFPHARTDAVSEIVLAIGRSEPGVDFGGKPVRLIFALGTPRTMIREYLGVVGALARKLKRPEVRAALHAATTPEEFLQPLIEP